MAKEENINRAEPNSLLIEQLSTGANLFLDELKLKNVYSFSLSMDAEDAPYGTLNLSLRVKL